jgi:Tripartite tricarboxylate transporter family receptor
MSSGARAAVATRADFDAKLAKELLIPSDFLDAKVEQREATREIKQPIWAAQRVEDTVLLGDLTSAVRPQSRRQRCANSPPARARPITIVVPAPAGGPRDTLARLLAEPMRTSLGQPVIIENVGGANGTIGTARVARAGPDGYTLVLGNWNSQMAASAVLSCRHEDHARVLDLFVEGQAAGKHDHGQRFARALGMPDDAASPPTVRFALLHPRENILDAAA